MVHRRTRPSKKSVNDMENLDMGTGFPQDIGFDISFDENSSTAEDEQRRKIRRSIEDYHERRRFMKNTEDPLHDISSDDWDLDYDK